MPEFYIIIARKIFSQIFGGTCPPCPTTSPTPMFFTPPGAIVIILVCWLVRCDFSKSKSPIFMKFGSCLASAPISTVNFSEVKVEIAVLLILIFKRHEQTNQQICPITIHNGNTQQHRVLYWTLCVFITLLFIYYRQQAHRIHRIN